MHGVALGDERGDLEVLLFLAESVLSSGSTRGEEIWSGSSSGLGFSGWSVLREEGFVFWFSH